MAADFRWTDEAIADMRRMLKEGASFSQIAVAIGCPSRNAVIGKAWRVGVAPGRKTAAEKPKAIATRKGPARNLPKRAKPHGLLPAGGLPKDPEARREVFCAVADRANERFNETVAKVVGKDSAGVLFLERSQFQCAMPAAGWDQAHVTEKRVCGAPTTGLTSYCVACEAIVYVPARQREAVTRQVVRGVAA